MSERAYILSEIKETLHQAEGLDILLTLQFRIIELMQCERVTVYTGDERTNELVSAVKTGRELDEIRIPLNIDSLAGGCLCLKAVKAADFLNISDVRNKAELSGYHPKLKFDDRWDNQTGFRTKAVLCYPLLYADYYYIGVLQLINPADREVFTEEDASLAASLAVSLTLFLKKHISETDSADMSQPESSKDAIRKVFEKHKVGCPVGIAPTIDKIITEWKAQSEILAQYKTLMSKIK